jgi:hypothetical protein
MKFWPASHASLTAPIPLSSLHDLSHEPLGQETSSAYTPVTQLCYADVAEHSRDAENEASGTRDRTSYLAGSRHAFPRSYQHLGRSHSRAYNVDSVGHFHQIHMLLYQVFGDRLWLHPVNFLFPPIPKQVIHHDGDVAFLQASNAWIASGTYHPQPGIERLTFDKTFPFHVSATSEFGAAEMPVLECAQGKFETNELLEYPCGELVTTTHLTSDYAVGSGTCQFHDGNQTDTFFVNCSPCGKAIVYQRRSAPSLRAIRIMAMVLAIPRAIREMNRAKPASTSSSMPAVLGRYKRTAQFWPSINRRLNSWTTIVSCGWC